MHFNGSKLDFSEIWCISVLEDFVIILANSADPDEMQHYAPFQLGLHCLQKKPVYKGLNLKVVKGMFNNFF